MPHSKRRTPADYERLAAQRGFRWLGPEVPNTATRSEWECELGHRWETTYRSIRRGKGCPHCAGIARKTAPDYLRLAEERGFRWLGPEVPNIRTRTGWECARGHRWETTYQSIRIGGGCPYCAGKARKTPDDYHALARQRGFRWLGPEVPNRETKTGWECAEGHRWQTTYHAVQRGSGCPHCARPVHPRCKTPADYHALAEERSYRWLGPEVANVLTKTFWECDRGHRWEARYNHIRQGSRCPFCARAAPKTPADYEALA